MIPSEGAEQELRVHVSIDLSGRPWPISKHKSKNTKEYCRPFMLDTAISDRIDAIKSEKSYDYLIVTHLCSEFSNYFQLLVIPSLLKSKQMLWNSRLRDPLPYI